jgi:nitrite reductase/ring-hydroxylating ferredoxin subunit
LRELTRLRKKTVLDESSPLQNQLYTAPFTVRATSFGDEMHMGIVKVASTKELASGQMKKVEAESKIILLVNLQGEYYAIGNRCTHMGCILSNGILKGENVQCPCHGSTFNVRTGAVVKGPATDPAVTFQVHAEGNQILINV